MRISTRYTLYQQSVLWPKFHKLLTMRQAASVSSVYNSRKGCTAQYLAGAGVQKPEYLLSLSCIFGDQLNRGNSVWLSWATKAGVIILTVLPHSPLSLAEKSCKSWHLQSLVWQPFSSNPRIQQNTKIVWQTKSHTTALECYFS